MWKLFLVKHPAGNFIGVAKSMEQAREHFGLAATIREIGEEEIIGFRADGLPERVFLAI